MQDRVLTEKFLKPYKTKKPPFGGNGLGEIVFRRTYARDKEDGTKEEWWETLVRAIEGAQAIGANYTREEAETLYDLMFNLKGLFSGRALWQLGTPLVEKLQANSMNNCWVTEISKISDFQFLMDNLMLGGGVGFSIERANVHDFPKVRENVSIKHERTNDADYIVPDSRQGWSSLLRRVLKSYFYNGRSFTYSTILVRGYGAPLKTFGGTASGPEVLIEGIGEICSLLDARAGKKIRSIDALDICNIIGKIVVAGSARRSAQLAAGDPDDYLFLRAKNWERGDIPGYRGNSNNSILADSFSEIIPEVWSGYDGSGEPYGFLNRRLARTQGRLGERVADNKVIGTNPCSEIWLEDGECCFTGDTKILTKNGYERIEDCLTDGSDLIEVYSEFFKDSDMFGSGTIQSAVCVETGERDVWRIETSDGSYIDATTEHPFVKTEYVNKEHNRTWCKVSDLEPGDFIVRNSQGIHSNTEQVPEAYALGYLLGDGWFLEGQKYQMGVCSGEADVGNLHKVRKVFEQIERQARPFAGSNYETRYEGNGVSDISVDKNNVSSFTVTRPYMGRYLESTHGMYPAKAADKKLPVGFVAWGSSQKASFLHGLFDADGSMSIGIRKAFYFSTASRQLANEVKLVLSEFGITSSVYEYEHKDGRIWFNLSIKGARNLRKLLNLVMIKGDLGLARKRNRIQEALSSVKLDQPEKYTRTQIVSITHVGLQKTYNLEVEGSRNFVAEGFVVHNCNLAEIFLPRIESRKELYTLSTLLYKTQKAITGLQYQHEKSQEVVRRNRRLGQGITGWMQATEEQIGWIDGCYKNLKKYDEAWSKKMGIPVSIKLTTVKPSGTLSLLPFVTPGIHPAYYRFGIRRVRIGSGDPLVQYCRDRGLKVQYDIGIDGKENHNLLVVDFPVEYPEHTITADKVTAIQQLEWLVKAQTLWSDNAVSVTCYYRKEELPEIKEWLSKNYDKNIKSVSFLLHQDHGFNLPPYEPVGEDEYRKMVEKLKDVEFEGNLGSDGMDLESCEGGACPIK